ncbi:MAG: hypothetical protein L6N95_05320 [Candidatus Methylarchaceae archaeon HK01B]|nr:hypothetical protein [Candidatus Methylarchaceae archaeon HK01M]MCP8312137.1 hypothetical protein [Candidatus Methylarchaceae archaeon HK02M1]MCP8319232.1 hypothetical protein [Candidatus Methylarchaceae archaeon HK01B]
MDRDRRIFMIGVITSIIFVVVGCLWLSSSLETLDEVAERFGTKEIPLWSPPLPDYEIPGLEGNTLANIGVGIGATLLILGLSFVTGKALKAKEEF